MPSDQSAGETVHSDRDHVATVWKVPEEMDIDVGDFHDIGIFPSGELMAICDTREDAEDLVDRLEENSPSDRFGESMEDAPYVFSISEEEIHE